MKVTEELKAKMRAYYHANKDKWQTPEHKAKDAEYRRQHPKERLANSMARRQRLREAIYEVKRQPCADCGIKYPPYVMDLDHRRGEKILDISTLIDQGYSITRVMAEVVKCDVVCSNCHRLRTYRDRGTIA